MQMGATSAEKELVLPAFSMSREQFFAFLQALRREFPEQDLTTAIVVIDGIVKHSYDTIDQLATDSLNELPDVVHQAEVLFANATSIYTATHAVQLKLTRGGVFEPELRNKAIVKGQTGSSVVAASSLINSAFWRRATIQGWLRLRLVLAILVVTLFMLFPTVVNATDAAVARHSAYGTWPFILYFVGFVCVAVFTGADRLYNAAFPSTWIEVRSGPRRWPYETLVFIIGFVALILALIALFHL
jgi:hypothetical protein